MQSQKRAYDDMNVTADLTAMTD